MMKIIEKTFDLQTGEETITERNETAAEVKSREKIAEQNLKRKEQEEANAIARAALLTKLGITSDEAKLLLG